MLDLSISLILVTGVGGVGKSAFSNALRTHLENAVVISKDSIASTFTESRGTDYYSSGIRDTVYDLLLKETSKTLQQNHTVIVDASFRKVVGQRYWFKPYQTLALENNAKFLIIRILASYETIYNRLLSRDHDAGIPERLKSLEDMIKWYEENEPLVVPLPDFAIMLSSERDMDENVKQTLHALI